MAQKYEHRAELRRTLTKHCQTMVEEKELQQIKGSNSHKTLYLAKRATGGLSLLLDRRGKGLKGRDETAEQI